MESYSLRNDVKIPKLDMPFTNIVSELETVPAREHFSGQDPRHFCASYEVNKGGKHGQGNGGKDIIRKEETIEECAN
jgi:hypothetical protein